MKNIGISPKKIYRSSSTCTTTYKPSCEVKNSSEPIRALQVRIA